MAQENRSIEPEGEGDEKRYARGMHLGSVESVVDVGMNVCACVCVFVCVQCVP